MSPVKKGANMVLRIFVLIIVLLALSSCSFFINGNLPITKMQLTPTPLFIHPNIVSGICEPPCFFGLVPGESTSEDVSAFLERINRQIFRLQVSDSSEFDLEAEHMVSGWYSCTLKELNSSENSYFVLRLYIDEEILTYIEVQIVDNNSRIPLQDILAAFGMPSSISLDIEELYLSALFLTVNYSEYNLSLDLVVDLIAGENCMTNTIEDDFFVHKILYMPTDFNVDERLGYAPTARVVSLEVWETWLDDTMAISCMDAWDQLPEQIPNLTLTPTSTQETE